MGCFETKNDSKLPMLICEFAIGKEDQKTYCVNMKDNFRHAKTIAFEIKETDHFKISFVKKGKVHVIQTDATLTPEMRDKTLQEAYRLLDAN